MEIVQFFVFSEKLDSMLFETFLRKSPPLFIHLIFTDGSLWSVEG